MTINTRHVGSIIAMGCLTMALFAVPNGGCRKPSSTDRPATPSDARPAKPPSLPRTDERRADRHEMVKTQIEARGVRDPRVLTAMRNVPRHWFVPASQTSRAYLDRPLPIGHGQTISQPFIVAKMTELLALTPGEKVLEIGTGSGYQAALLAEITDNVFTIEIVEPLAKQTIELLHDRGYDRIQTRIGDGYRGWPSEAPFDAIIVTCAPDNVPKPLTEQLALGGRLCIPVGSGWKAQELIVLEKQTDGQLIRRTVFPVRFVPMTGEAEGTAKGGRPKTEN